MKSIIDNIHDRMVNTVYERIWLSIKNECWGKSHPKITNQTWNHIHEQTWIKTRIIMELKESLEEEINAINTR